MGPLHLSNSDKNSNDLYTCMSVCNSNAITDHTECSPITGGLLYLFLHFKDVKIAALLDSGSTTNLMSYSLYSRLPNSVKSNLQPLSFDKLELANGSFVTMIGTARVTCIYPD